MAEIENVAVIGGGTMGSGIAQTFAMSGMNVNLVELRQDLMDRALNTIHKSLDRMVTKKMITQPEREQVTSRIHPYLNSASAAGNAGLIIEAVPENYDLKRKVLTEIDKVAGDHAILATNTSSISITRLAAATDHPERFIGMHFFNPVPVMKLIEIVNGMETDKNVTRRVMETARRLDKTPVAVNDSPGFVSNRILMPMINEAIYCVYEGVGTPKDIDAVMKLGMAHPMGPLRLADFIGLDVCLDILHVLYEGFKDPKYRPCPLLVKMVDAGKLGDKTGIGFYSDII